MVTIAPAADAVTAGGPQFRLSAEPAPTEDLTVKVTIASPDCKVAQKSESVTIVAGKSHALLTVPTTGVEVGADGCEVIARIAIGDGYEVGAAPGASASVTLRRVTPVVTIAADAETVPEGSPVSFTLTASPKPAADLTVSVNLSQSGSFLTGSAPRAVTVTIPPSGTAKLKADTDNDEEHEPDGSVTITVGAGDGYTVGEPKSATVAVTDDDPTTPSAGPATPGPAIPGPAIPAPTTPFPRTPFPRTPSPTPEDTTPTPEDTTPTTAVTITGPGAAPIDSLPHASAVSVDEGATSSVTLTATPAPESDLTVTLSWLSSAEAFNWPEVEDLKLTPRPATVTIPTSGTTTFTVTAGNDNKRNLFRRTNDLISVWPGNGYKRGAKYRLYFYIKDDDR